MHDATSRTDLCISPQTGAGPRHQGPRPCVEKVPEHYHGGPTPVRTGSSSPQCWIRIGLTLSAPPPIERVLGSGRGQYHVATFLNTFTTRVTEGNSYRGLNRAATHRGGGQPSCGVGTPFPDALTNHPCDEMTRHPK